MSNDNDFEEHPAVTRLREKADLVRRSKQIAARAKALKVADTILDELACQTPDFSYVRRGHLPEEVIEALAEVGVTATNLPIDCDCDPRESCGVCERGYCCELEMQK